MSTPETINISADALASLQGRLAALESQQAAADAARREAEEQALIAAGRGSEVVARHRQEIGRIRERTSNYAADAALRQALAAQPLADAAAADQLRQLLRAELVADVDLASGQARVRTKDYRSVEDLVKTTLARPDYAHFLRPGNPGQPAPTGRLAAPGTPPPVTAPPALTEADLVVMPISLQHGVAQRLREASGGDPATDLSLPFGLRGRR